MTANQIAYQAYRRRNTILRRNLREAMREAMAAGEILTIHGRTTGTNHNNRNCNTVKMVESLRAAGKIKDGDTVWYIRGAHLMRGTEGWQWIIMTTRASM